MNHPSQQLSLWIQGFDVWFGTLYWFINAVIHFSKPLSSLVSNLQDHILENIFSLPQGEDLSHLGVGLQVTFFHTWHVIFPSLFFYPQERKNPGTLKAEGQETWRLIAQNYCYPQIGSLCLYLHLTRRVRNQRQFSLSLCFFIKENKSLSTRQASPVVSGVLGHRPPSSLCSPSVHFCRTCYRCLWRLSQSLVKPLSHTVRHTLLFVHYL